MDHNANAVALADLTSANRLFTATYHVYVGDTNGNPVSGYGDTTTTWSWHGPSVAVVPAPAIAWTQSQITISWATTVTNLTLVSADTLAETNWAAVTNQPRHCWRPGHRKAVTLIRPTILPSAIEPMKPVYLLLMLAVLTFPAPAQVVLGNRPAPGRHADAGSLLSR